MTLEKITKYLEIKVRRESWPKGEYVYFDGVAWWNREGRHVTLSVWNDRNQNDWVVY